jgi:hypothetical protein
MATPNQPNSELHLDKPCTKSWKRMLPLKNGKFCENGECPVLDFTDWKKDDIHQFFADKANAGTCGRFKPEHADQVNFKGYITNYFDKGFTVKKIAGQPLAVFLGLTFFFNSAFMECMVQRHSCPSYGNDYSYLPAGSLQKQQIKTRDTDWERPQLKPYQLAFLEFSKGLKSHYLRGK